jgi:hypothetical protein
MVLLKNILRSDSSSYLSTFLLSHNPEKKITTLIDFSIPNNIKNDIKEKILGTGIIGNNEIDENSNLLKSTNLLFLSKYIDDMIMIHPPLYMSESTYNGFLLSKGVFNSQMEHGKRIKVSSKGKPFNFQIQVFENKYDVSNLWYSSKYSSKYDGLLNIGKYSGIWSNYNYMFIDKTEILFSQNDLDKKYYFNENMINIKCNTTFEIIEKRIYENNNYFNNYTLFDQNILDSKCVSLSSVILKESHLGLHEFDGLVYNIVLDPNSNINYLPAKLYFKLYEQDTETSSAKKINKKVVKSNFIKLKFLNKDLGDSLQFNSKGIFDFTLNVNNDYDVVLGADMFKYFSKIKYSKMTNEYNFWIDSITSDNNILLISISFIVIIDTILFVRWYLTSHLSVSTYVLFYILINKKTFYYNNSQSFAEMISCLLGIIVVIISIISICNSTNLPIYIFVVFGILSTMLLLSIGTSIAFLIQSKDKITNIFSSKKSSNPKHKDESLKRWTLFSSEYNTPKFIYKKRKEEEEEEEKSKRIQRILTLIDKNVLKLYSITTPSIINQDIMISIARQITHMSVIFLTMLTGLSTAIEERLVKAMLTLISILLVFQLMYYIFLVILAFIKFHKNLNKSIWLTFIIISTILLFIFTPFICFVSVFNFLDSMNSNHPTFVVALTAIVLVCLLLMLAPYLILNQTEEWLHVINNELNIKIGDEDIGKNKND